MAERLKRIALREIRAYALETGILDGLDELLLFWQDGRGELRRLVW